MKPFYAGQKGERREVLVDLGKYKGVVVKRMTAPSVDEKDAGKVTWGGQSFRNGNAIGAVTMEKVEEGGKVKVRDSEAVLVTFL
ncbi:hypothetical protein QBC44DRAFT_337010 [Cladorrhinum sp. PSN332]|nr:hypothetical protein QBC44DRAFT_337010 [Cladorrhinum sp. PSN332]